MEMRRLSDPPAESGLFPASGPGMLAMPTPSPDMAGPALRTARERMGMTLQDVAAETRIAVRHLTALEEARFDGFAAPVYVMGFARNYARAVGVSRDWISDCLRDEVEAQFGQRHRFDLGWSAEGTAQSPRGWR
ncbi:MAG: helix-turn-helix domain-containing protein [Sphingomonas sp.]|nr:MAG: helix-turn-helix domain-containing protein [Sphingomonas sp.]